MLQCKECGSHGTPSKRLERTQEVSEIHVLLCCWLESLTQYFLSSQQMIDGFTVIKKKPPPPITKAGMMEYIFELIVDGDLVSVFLFISGCLCHISSYCSLFALLSSHPFIACYVIPTQNSPKKIFQWKHVLQLRLTRRWWSWMKLIKVWLQ